MKEEIFFPHVPGIWHSVRVKYFGRFTKMSFGVFTKLDYLILDNSLLAIEKLGIVTKPGEACTSFSPAQCFYLLQPWLCSLGVSFGQAQNCSDFIEEMSVWRSPLQVHHLAQHSFGLMAALQTENEIYSFSN